MFTASEYAIVGTIGLVLCLGACAKVPENKDPNQGRVVAEYKDIQERCLNGEVAQAIFGNNFFDFHNEAFTG